MNKKINKTELQLFYIYAIVIGVIWIVLITSSLFWNIITVKKSSVATARIEAHTVFEKDVMYRRWNAMHGGLYAPVTETSQPNQYLKVSERDITTPSGIKLTKINPAYMTRQVHELGKDALGVEGHITSLNPIRAENIADAWEKQALTAFESGTMEFVSIIRKKSGKYLRFMRPLITEKGCLKCHAAQGYKVGDIRGGISVSVPMTPFYAVAQKQILILVIVHSCLLLIGLGAIGVAGHYFQKQIKKRIKIKNEREKIIKELQDALDEVKTLSGLLPICSHCKKIRDDKGYWKQIDVYIQKHSEAKFTHSMCPECSDELYGNEDWYIE
ncbi:DUF3365 domain-containing protein, partial [bacterium]|nr:DUF3365 domain-containing protein [bacterium]